MNIEKVFSPYDQSLLVEIKFDQIQDLKIKFQQSLSAQKNWAKKNKDERIQIIEKFNQYLLDNRLAIGKKISTFIGRPIRFAPKEVDTGVARSRVMLEFYREKKLEEIVDSQRSIVHLPRGNMLVFGAWNYPVLTAINSIVPAILSGNSVCFRSSSQTYFMGEVFSSAFKYAGLPENVFQQVSFSHEQTREVLSFKEIHGVVYTGSTEGGTKIHQWCGGKFIPITLELGGKDAAYVREEVDLENAAINIADGAFFNSGQSCCGVERVYVHEKNYARFLELMIKEGKSLKLGNPLEESTTLGPMAKKSAVKFLKDQLNEARSKGAKTHLDELGEINPQGQFIRPEIITNIDNQFSIQQEETFGPYVTICSVKNDQEAISKINDSKFGLTASIWTTDQTIAKLLAKDLEVGVVMINRCDYVDPLLPWRGEKLTGMGHSLGPNCFDSFLKPRSIYIQNEKS